MTVSGTEPPTGDVTFLFTDVEGSTGLWERQPDAMRIALEEHDRRLRAAIDAHNGYVFTTAGDSFAAAFTSVPDALAATIDAQLHLLEPCGDIDIRIRIGLHTGVASVRDGDYFGAVVNRCARIMSAGHGGQILLSGATATLVRSDLDPPVELVDLGEHRLKDLLRPEHIYRVRHPELADRFAPFRTLEGPSSNLPIQLTSFVGRERELTEVGGLLTSNRLVTLTGTGGAGKTRLALQVAADALDDFPDGIRLVELAPVSDPEVAIDEVAQRVGAVAVPDVSIGDTIASTIGGQRMLVVLDNCEHLVEPVADLVGRLLHACSDVRILATSRERLGVSGEAAYRVPSLAVPDDADLRHANESDAVTLFTERATLAKPDFAVTTDNVEAVVAICRRLDGIPLAVELAAARLRMLSPAQVAERLDERFRLLGGHERGALERHQTLQATIDWSYDHLSEAEQRLFDRTSVFAGSFSLEAAQGVCSDEDLDEFAVLELLAGLVDKSMIVPEEEGGLVRYRLLESMRMYGTAKLRLRTDDRDVVERHEEYYATMAEALQSLQRGGGLAEALTALETDEDNVRAALRSSLDQHRYEHAARIIGAAGYLWYTIGSFREGVEWCRELFAAEPDLSDEMLAAAIHNYATLLGSWDHAEAGAELMKREIEIRRRLGDPVRLAAALNNYGNFLDDLGQTQEAIVVLHESIENYRAGGESASIALTSLGGCYAREGDHPRAEALFRESLDEADDPYVVAVATTYLGESTAHQGRWAEARALVQKGHDDFESLGVIPGIGHTEFFLALIDRADGDAVAAARASC